MTNYPCWLRLPWLLTELLANHADYLGYELLRWVMSPNSILPTPSPDCSTRHGGQMHSLLPSGSSLAPRQAALWQKWHYSKAKNRMYINGHKRDNVMAYQQAFIYWWVEYETHFQIWDGNGDPLLYLSDLCPLILITHDELVFFPKWWKEDLLESSRQPASPQTKRQWAITDGLGFLDSWVGMPAWW